jgi:acetoacetate decarboxylase
MDRTDVLQLLSTPVNAPAYPPGPYRFTNREYLHITYAPTRPRCAASFPNHCRCESPRFAWK